MHLEHVFWWPDVFSVSAYSCSLVLLLLHSQLQCLASSFLENEGGLFTVPFVHLSTLAFHCTLCCSGLHGRQVENTAVITIILLMIIIIDAVSRKKRSNWPLAHRQAHSFIFACLSSSSLPRSVPCVLLDSSSALTVAPSFPRNNVTATAVSSRLNLHQLSSLIVYEKYLSHSCLMLLVIQL